MSFIKFFPAIIISICLYLPCYCQTQKKTNTTTTPHHIIQDRIFWDGNTLFTQEPGISKPIFREEAGANPLKITPPPQTFSISFHLGKFYSLQLSQNNEPNSELEMQFLYSNDAKSWKKIATVDTTHGIPLSVEPFSDGKSFLAANTGTGFTDGKSGSNFAIFTLTNNNLVFDKLLLLEIEGKNIFNVEYNIEKFPIVTIAPNFASIIPFIDHPIRSENGLLIISKRTGMTWYIDDKHPSQPTAYPIYSLEKSEFGPKSKLELAILVAHPTRNGKILLAGREESGFRNASAFYKTLREENKTNSNTDQEIIHEKDLFLERNRSLETFCELVWLEFDSHDKKFERVFPKGRMDRVANYTGFSLFNFRINTNDEVVIYSGRTKISAESAGKSAISTNK